MQGHLDETEFLRNRQLEDELMLVDTTEVKEPLLKQIKAKLFSVFFRLNTLRIEVGMPYHVIMLLIETFQLLSLVLVDGSYTSLGPYQADSPWNLSQTQWLIDVCWIFRVDRYFRSSLAAYASLMCIWLLLLASIVGLCVVLAFLPKVTAFSNFIAKSSKVLITLLCDIVFIPIVDSLVFGMRCSLGNSSECLGLQQDYAYLILFICALVVVAAAVGFCSLLYYDFCMVCGGLKAKPHARIKLLRLLAYVVVDCAFYFTTSSARVVLFLLVALGVGVVMCFINTQYIPYYNPQICKMRLASIVSFTSAVFCMLIGEFFKTTDQTNSSVTMLFYFLTPCLIQITQLALMKRGKNLRDRKVQNISNIYQVEIKGRMHVSDIEAARSRSTKNAYLDEDESPEDNFTNVHNRSLREIETLYSESFKKFPNSELLYLWSGMLQLHMFESYVLAMVQCHKGLLIANKLDSQYALYHFSKTAASCYKQYMKDDAYDYVLFEQCLSAAERNDESVTRSQYYFWAELESKAPKLPKLISLAGEISRMIGITKRNYHLLMKLNPKSTEAMKMYGNFLNSLNNFTELSSKYTSMANTQEEAQKKNTNANVLGAINQPLSFFDSANVIISVSGDFETLGEILQVSEHTVDVLGYTQNELAGRNISLLIPSPFSDTHDDYMRRFHEAGTYSMIDNSGLCLYYVNKRGLLFEARTLIKVVPCEDKPPFLMAAIQPTKPKYGVFLLNHEYFIAAASDLCEEMFSIGITKNSDVKIDTLILNFDEIKVHMDRDEYVDIRLGKGSQADDLRGCLSRLVLGSHFAYVLKILSDENQGMTSVERKSQADPERSGSEFSRPVSTLKSASGSKDARINFALDHSEDSDDADSESENESESEEASSSESQSKEDSSSHMGPKVELQQPLFPSDAPSTEHQKSLVDHRDSSPGDTEQLPSSSYQSKSQSISESHSQDDDNDEELEDEEAESIPENDMMSVASSHFQGRQIMKLSVFNSAIKALVSFEFARTKKYVWRFKTTMLLTIGLLIATSVATFTVIKQASERNEKLSHFVNLVGDLRLDAVSLAYYVRVVTLMDSGFIPSQQRDTYLQWLSEDARDLHDINLLLYRNYDFLSVPDRNVYIEDHIPTWFLDGGALRMAHTNLFDATAGLFLQTHLILEQLRTPPLAIRNKRPYYVYRNGEGELLDYINRSARFYVDSALRDVEQERIVAILLIVVSVLVLLLCAGLAIIPAILTLAKSKQDCWNIFFEVPIYVCRLMKGRCNDRLRDMTDITNIEIEEAKMEPSIEENEGDSKPIAKDSDKEALRKHSHSDDLRKRVSSDPRQRKIITIKLSCFFLISVVYFYLIYYTGFDSIGGVMEEEPITIDWASRRRQLSRSINFWVLEALVENTTGIGFKDIVSAGQNLGSPFRRAEWNSNELEYVENSLIFGNLEEGLTFNEMRGSVHDQLMFTDACIAPVNRSLSDCETVGNRAMKQGLHSALGMYVTLSRTILQAISSAAAASNWSYSLAQSLYQSEDMQLLRALDEHYLYDPLYYSSRLYERDYRSSQESMTMWQNLLVSMYSVFAVMFFLLVYHPMIRKVRRRQIGSDTKNSWSMCALMPYEYRDKFKLLTATIKARKDSFKWR